MELPGPVEPSVDASLQDKVQSESSLPQLPNIQFEESEFNESQMELSSSKHVSDDIPTLLVAEYDIRQRSEPPTTITTTIIELNEPSLQVRGHSEPPSHSPNQTNNQAHIIPDPTGKDRQLSEPPSYNNITSDVVGKALSVGDIPEIMTRRVTENVSSVEPNTNDNMKMTEAMISDDDDNEMSSKQQQQQQQQISQSQEVKDNVPTTTAVTPSQHSPPQSIVSRFISISNEEVCVCVCVLSSIIML